MDDAISIDRLMAARGAHLIIRRKAVRAPRAIDEYLGQEKPRRRQVTDKTDASHPRYTTEQ
jgi:hypothetical protein